MAGFVCCISLRADCFFFLFSIRIQNLDPKDNKAIWPHEMKWRKFFYFLFLVYYVYGTRTHCMQHISESYLMHMYVGRWNPWRMSWSKWWWRVKMNYIYLRKRENKKNVHVLTERFFLLQKDFCGLQIQQF